MAITITDVSPIDGSVIAATDFVVVDVTSTAGFSALIVVAQFPGYQITEVVAVTSTFLPAYNPSSTAVAITNGFRFTIRRSPIWPDSPTVIVTVVDTAGATGSGDFSWLIAGAPPTAGLALTEPEFPSSPGPGDCPAPVHDQDYFLEVLHNFLASDYVAGLQAGQGYELLQAFASIGVRISQAIERFECGQFILSAQGGSNSVGSVEFYREDFSAGGYLLAAGTRVTTSLTGRDFVTTASVTVGPTDLGPFVVPVQAVWQGWEWNTRGQSITRRGETIPGEIDTIKLPILEVSTSNSTPVIDPALRVRQITAQSGGAAPMLDGLGDDRGLPRRGGEGDDAYRVRLRTLPDTVSPQAIQRFLETMLTPYNAHAEFIELWDIRFQTCWDAPDDVPAAPTYDPTTFMWDDPRPPPPHVPSFYGRWLDEVTMAGAFVAVIPQLQPILDYGMAYDDPITDVAELVSTDFPPGTDGTRAISAYDLAAAVPPGVEGAYDGEDVAFNALVTAIFQTFQHIKAGGVTALVELEGA